MKVLSLIFVVVSLLAASDAHPGGLDANGEKAYWISSTGKTHNKSCRYYRACKGHASDTPSGVNCKICGGANH